MYFTEIDHLFLLTADLDRSCEEWKRLGFNMSERGYHNDALGTANHLAIFNDTYFEILGVLKHRPSNELYRTFLEAGDGLRGIAFRPNDDLDKIVQRRRRASIATKDAIAYERPVPDMGLMQLLALLASWN